MPLALTNDFKLALEVHVDWCRGGICRDYYTIPMAEWTIARFRPNRSVGLESKSKDSPWPFYGLVGSNPAPGVLLLRTRALPEAF